MDKIPPSFKLSCSGFVSSVACSSYLVPSALPCFVLFPLRERLFSSNTQNMLTSNWNLENCSGLFLGEKNKIKKQPPQKNLKNKKNPTKANQPTKKKTEKVFFKCEFYINSKVKNFYKKHMILVKLVKPKIVTKRIIKHTRDIKHSLVSFNEQLRWALLKFGFFVT